MSREAQAMMWWCIAIGGLTLSWFFYHGARVKGICRRPEAAYDLSNRGMDDEANVAHRFKIGRTSNDFILKPKHKIFLSHSGVQKEFVWHLCEALERRGHNPFFDKLSSSLPKGERFPELILKAAQQCEMVVVVVSEEYFMSKWPMIELHAFVQVIKKKSNTKLKILPLFYGLSVSEFLDEKRQKRWFQVWKKWAKDDPKKQIKVGEWKEALDFLRSYNGIAYNRELQEIVPYQNDIISHICGLISPDIKCYDSHVQGKSNICKLKDILKKRISSQKTFLALDNVWNDFQSIQHARMILEAPFLKGSLVFVTAQSKNTLELLGLHGDACIEMPELGEGDAINLFLYHAARGKQFGTKEEKHDILQCVRRCYFDKGGGQGFHYHPLALEALGLQLRCVGDKPLESMKNLPKVRNFSYFAGENPVFDILRSSFDLLEHTEQSLFLDLICYRPFVVQGCKFGLSMVVLMEWLCLVYKVDEDEIRSRLDRLKGKGLLQDVDLTSGTISVHDLYFEFAELELEGKLDESTDLENRRWMKIGNSDQLTELERTPSGRCWQKLVRLGIFHRDAANPIESLEGIEWQYFSNVVILELERLDCLRGTLNLKGLKCLRSLHLGNILGLDTVEGLEGLKNLSYLKWIRFGSYSGDYIETRIGQFPASLRVLHIGVAIWLGPNVLARCNNLRKLTLSGIRADTLDLSDCSSLQSVTLSWIRADTLDLSDCSSLQSVRLNDARVRKLQFLSITGRCASSLKSLSLFGIRDLAGIPGLDQLIGLERLALSYCSLKELPDLQKLTKLKLLHVMGSLLKRKEGLEVTGGYCIPPQLREIRGLCDESSGSFSYYDHNAIDIIGGDEPHFKAAGKFFAVDDFCWQSVTASCLGASTCAIPATLCDNCAQSLDGLLAGGSTLEII